MRGLAGPQPRPEEQLREGDITNVVAPAKGRIFNALSRQTSEPHLDEEPGVVALQPLHRGVCASGPLTRLVAPPARARAIGTALDHEAVAERRALDQTLLDGPIVEIVQRGDAPVPRSRRNRRGRFQASLDVERGDVIARRRQRVGSVTAKKHTPRLPVLRVSPPRSRRTAARRGKLAQPSIDVLDRSARFVQEERKPLAQASPPLPVRRYLRIDP